MLVDGRSSKQIGVPLGIEVRTVKAHVAKLMRKVGVRNRIALATYAMSHSLVSSGQIGQDPTQQLLDTSRPVHLRAAPIDYGPVLLLNAFRIPPSRWTPCPPEYNKRWLQVGLGCVQLSPSCPFRPRPYLPLSPASEAANPASWIWRPSFARQRDFNPPQRRAAQGHTSSLPTIRSESVEREVQRQESAYFMLRLPRRCCRPDCGHPVNAGGTRDTLVAFDQGSKGSTMGNWAEATS
jgi:regulatory LuxR family protein